METKAGHKLVRSAKAQGFDEERLDSYTLVLQIGTRDFQAMAWNEKSGLVEWLEDYSLQETSSHLLHMHLVRDLIESHFLLPARFWKRLIVGFKTDRFIQVPKSIFHAEAAADYLSFNCRIEPGDVVMSGPCHYAGTETAFAAPGNLVDWLNGYYQAIPKEFVHQSSAIITGAARYGGSGRTLHLFADRFRVHIICVSKERLEYYNQFAIRQFGDYMRYLGLAINALGLDPEKCPLILWGYLGADSPVALEFGKYVKNLHLGTRQLPVRMGIGISGIQDHQFMDLMALPFTQPFVK